METDEDSMEDPLNARGGCDDGAEEPEPEPNLCGICFKEEGKAMRGEIDSCDHYFCFVCIMEWAKVESRCPVCKQRFEKIVRPSNGGFFSSERVVRVPARDQANHHHFDPYVDTLCSICGGMQDECYLLLCDLCDSAVHTYCVGLGYTVPSGDWFCDDCSILRREHSNIDEDCNHVVENQTIRSIKEQVSIFEIVREELNNRAVESPATVSAIARERLVVADKASDFDARTVRRCRNVCNRIQLFRENWEALRQGYLYFSSRPLEHSEENSAKRRRICTVEHDETNQPVLSSLGVTDESAGSSAPQDNYDIDRAWKMMDKARSKQSTHSLASKAQQTGKSTVIRDVGCNNLQSRNPLMRTRDIIQSIRSMTEERMKQITRSESTALHVNDFSAKLADTSKRRDQHRPLISAKEERSEFTIPPVSNFSGASMGKCYRRDHQPSLTLLSPVSFTAVPGMSTSSTHQFHEEDRGQKVSATNHLRGKNGMESAKSEIQSLVKINLKVLSSRKLETDSFKQIARAATHTILAACGFEDSKSVVPAIQASVCPHAARSHQLRKFSSLMPGSCRDCFCMFVRDVVKSTMTQTLGTPE